MKTLFAFGTGVVLGTVAALWLAARRALQGDGGGEATVIVPPATMPATPAATDVVEAIETASEPTETLVSEEAPQ